MATSVIRVKALPAALASSAAATYEKIGKHVARPAHQADSTHVTRKTLTVQSTSAKPSAWAATAASAEIAFRFGSSVTGPLRRVYAHIVATNATAASAAADIIGTRSLDQVRWRINGQALGELSADALSWSFQARHSDESALTSLGCFGLDTAGDFTPYNIAGDAVAEWFVDITGPLAGMRLVPAVLGSEALEVRFKLSAISEFCTVSSTLNLTSLELICAFDDDGLLALHEEVARVALDVAYVEPHILPTVVMSGTTLLADEKLGVSGEVAFIMGAIRDVSADVNQTREGYSALYATGDALKVENGRGVRIGSQSSDFMSKAEVYLNAEHAFSGHSGAGSALARKGIWFVPFCEDPVAALEDGVRTGSMPFHGDERISIRSADSAADQLQVICWVWRVLKIRLSRAAEVDDVVNR